MKSIDKPTRVVAIVLLFVFAIVVFHAPISVFFGQFLPESIVKGWKEILMLVVTPLVAYIVWRAGAFKQFSQDLLIRLIVLYALLHFLLLALGGDTQQKLAGLAIDLRYFLFFVLVFVVVSLQPNLRKIFLKVGAVAATLSLGFAALQATVLPHDIIKYIGYNKDTIEPYLTVDKNNAYIRINGTLRGPNPLGSYVVICLSLLLAFTLKRWHQALRYIWRITVATIIATISLWASYSRSAFVAIATGIGVIFLVVFRHKIRRKYWLATCAIVVIFAGGIFAARDSSFIQNVVLHNNPNGGSQIDSNENHLGSLEDSSQQFFLQPLGAGIGSTGSASLRGDNPLVIENQYLFVAHESGWLGLGLFLVILNIILQRLYQNRRDWLSLGVFASGIGLVLIGLILPVWVDDTVSLVWFGLSAVALASHFKKGKSSVTATN